MTAVQEAAGPSFRQVLMKFFSAYGLVVLLFCLIIVFSLLLPTSFPTLFNLRTILNHQSIIILLSLAVMIPMATNNFDMSVGYMVGISHIMTILLQNLHVIPWWLVVIIIAAGGAFVGLINGLLVTRVGIDAFIATLGTGTILYGLAFFSTGGAQILGDNLSKGFRAMGSNFLGIPISVFFVIFVGALLWVVFEHLPLGRYLYVLGSNPRSAELVGVSKKKYITLAFIASSAITAIAGTLLSAQLLVAQISVGPDYMLPAFTGAMLGATTIRPGRMNVIGTILAVLLLAVAVSGLQQMGAAFYVEPLFNGTMLILAVSFSLYTSRRQIKAAAITNVPEANE
jgi:ribose transport system permease protein